MKSWMKSAVLTAKALCLAAGSLVASTAAAQDCGLSLRTDRKVVWFGETAGVNVFAHHGPGVFAYASAEFDVIASEPGWVSATDGVLIGSTFTGIQTSQAHSPHTGQPANPASPLRVWRGVYTPADRSPGIVTFTADPDSFMVYPSDLTSSAAPCDPSGMPPAEDFLLVNPLKAGRWLAAPGAGTSISVSDDVIVDGRIITAENPPSVQFMLLPAIQSAREATVRIGFDDVPERFSFGVQVQRASMPTESVSYNFTKVEFNSSNHNGVHAMLGDGSVRFLRDTIPVGRINVSTSNGDEQVPAVRVLTLPDEVHVAVGPRIRTFLSPSDTAVLTRTFRFDEPTVVLLGDGRVLTIDEIEIETELPRAGTVSNNIKQLALACHNYEAAGVMGMTIRPIDD